MNDPQLERWLDACCDRLEADWARKQPAEDLAEYLPAEAAGETAQSLLLELVLVDLERRWRGSAANPPPGDQPASPSQCPFLSDYVARYPLLGALDALPAAAWKHEFRVRQRWGDRMTVCGFLERHPQARPHASALRNAAAAMEPMFLRCEGKTTCAGLVGMPGELELGRRRSQDPPGDFAAHAVPRPKLIIASRDTVAVSRKQLLMEVEGVLRVRVHNLGMNKVLIDKDRTPLTTDSAVSLYAPFRLKLADMAIHVAPATRRT